MSSEKQIAANRANALKSTGPKTPEGKARTSMNALRHGALARSYVLHDECSDEFRLFTESFHREYQPRTATEIALTDTMATARWRLIRLANMETASLDYESNRLTEPDIPFAIRAALAHRQAISGSRSLDAINRGESRLQRQFDSAFDRLRLIQADYLKQDSNREGLSFPGANDHSNPIEDCGEHY